MKEWLKQVANVFAWFLGVAIISVLVVSGVYFILGWHKKKEGLNEGTVSNPNSKLDKLHCDKIVKAVNSMWSDSKGDTGKNTKG